MPPDGVLGEPLGCPIRPPDLAGNVAEWTSSSYDSGAYEYVASLNPNMSLQTESRKVVRGGSWKDIAYFLRVSARDYEYKDEKRSCTKVLD